MNEDLSLQWIRSSIFYDRVGWTDLIKGGIEPFLKKNLNRQLIDMYYIHFSNYPIYHIKFTFKSVETNKEKLENNFLDWMDAFLINNPSETRDFSYRFYSNNSVWINQYNEKDFYLNSTFEENIVPLRKQISIAIMENSSDIIDSEGIFSLAIYLQLGIVRAVYSEVDEASVALIDLNQYLNQPDIIKSNMLKKGSSVIFNNILKNNDDLFVAIVDDLWGNNDSEDLLWLKDWVNSCNKFSNIDFNLLFLVLSRIIYEQLGLDIRRLIIQTSRLFMKSFQQY